MFNDSFKQQYTTLPIAVYTRNYRANTMDNNIETLSHHHREVELLYVLDGEANYYINSREYHIQKGDIVMVAPYFIHRATILAAKDFAHHCLCFDLKIIPDEQLRTGLLTMPPILFHKEVASSELGCYISNAFHAVNCKINGWELKAIGYLSLFFSKLKELGLFQCVSKERTKNNFCYQVINYIDTNYMQNITSNHAAKALYMNNSYFCHKFKANFGYSFQKYIEAYRIDKAKTLLKTTALSISEVALSVGYHDFSYFAKTFRSSQNCTPSQYRKHNCEISSTH